MLVRAGLNHRRSAARGGVALEPVCSDRSTLQLATTPWTYASTRAAGSRSASRMRSCAMTLI